MLKVLHFLHYDKISPGGELLYSLGGSERPKAPPNLHRTVKFEKALPMRKNEAQKLISALLPQAQLFKRRRRQI
jgi:hypothetical protein